MFLPYFNILMNDINIDKNRNMYSNEVPVKPRRKKIQEVPTVHKIDSEKLTNNRSNYKTYSANFNPKKLKQKRLDQFDQDESQNVEENLYKVKTSKKVLLKENEKLFAENNDLKLKISLTEDYLNKKNCKLKEKFNETLIINQELVNENYELKKQMQIYQSDIETCRNCKKCEEFNRILEQRNKDFESVQKVNKEHEEDISMLKNVIYRLNVQLERYQDKLQKCNINFNQYVSDVQLSELCENIPIVNNENLSGSHWEHSHTPISWGKVNAHTLGPLLDAYQDTINEKEYILQMYQNEFAKFSGKLREIIRENEYLHKQLNEDKDCSKVLLIDIAKIKNELQNSKDENDLLIKKCALKQDKLDEVLNCYEQKVEQIQRDYNVLYEQYCKSRTEVTMLKDKNKSLNATFEEIKNERQQFIPISLHNSSVNECKRWYDELKHQYEIEKSKLSDNIQSLNNKITDLTSKITSTNAEKDDLETKLKNTEKIIKKAETKYLDLQHTLHEVQLSRSACRKQLNKALNFAKDLVTEQETLLKALNQRQQETKAVKKIGTDIANRMDSLKFQIKTVQKDAWQELSFVEQRMKEQNEFITKLKEEHSEEIDQLKKLLNQKEEMKVCLSGNASIPLSPYLLFKDKHLKT